MSYLLFSKQVWPLLCWHPWLQFLASTPPSSQSSCIWFLALGAMCPQVKSLSTFYALLKSLLNFSIFCNITTTNLKNILFEFFFVIDKPKAVVNSVFVKVNTALRFSTTPSLACLLCFLTLVMLVQWCCLTNLCDLHRTDVFLLILGDLSNILVVLPLKCREDTGVLMNPLSNM